MIKRASLAVFIFMTIDDNFQQRPMMPELKIVFIDSRLSNTLTK